MTADRERALAYAAGLTVAVGVLAGVLARMTVLVPMDGSDSTVEARIARVLVVGAILAVAVLYVAVPTAVAAVRARGDGRALRHAGAAAVAVLGAPLAFVAATVSVEYWAAPGRVLPVLVGMAVVGVLLAALFAAAALDRLPPTLGRLESAWPVALNVLVVVLFVVGFLGVQPFAGGFADAHTETYGGFGGPHAVFEVEEEPAGDGTLRLTFTHAGGDPLHPEHLSVRGEGFADVEGADHVGPGVWQGSVSGERPRRGGPAVVTGDSVTVGVTETCRVGLVYESDDDSNFVAAHDCRRS